MTRKIYGVDFSGAKNAGNLAWITGGSIKDKVLNVEMCQPLRCLPGSSRIRDNALAALCKFILDSRDGIFGVDFPPSIPQAVTKHSSWDEIIKNFVSDYPDAQTFKQQCFNAASRESRRKTDDDTGTPFSPYNLRMYKQTYHGIRNVILPLFERGACILPMQRPRQGSPWIIEICPASTLKKEGLYGPPYKRSNIAAKENRQRILSQIGRIASFVLNPDQQRIILENNGGDALDSLIAALATFRAYRDKTLERIPSHPYSFEGQVFS